MSSMLDSVRQDWLLFEISYHNLHDEGSQGAEEKT